MGVETFSSFPRESSDIFDSSGVVDFQSLSKEAGFGVQAISSMYDWLGISGLERISGGKSSVDLIKAGILGVEKSARDTYLSVGYSVLERKVSELSVDVGERMGMDGKYWLYEESQVRSGSSASLLLLRVQLMNYDLGRAIGTVGLADQPGRVACDDFLQEHLSDMVGVTGQSFGSFAERILYGQKRDDIRSVRMKRVVGL